MLQSHCPDTVNLHANEQVWVAFDGFCRNNGKMWVAQSNFRHSLHVMMAKLIVSLFMSTVEEINSKSDMQIKRIKFRCSRKRLFLLLLLLGIHNTMITLFHGHHHHHYKCRWSGGSLSLTTEDQLPRQEVKVGEGGWWQKFLRCRTSWN